MNKRKQIRTDELTEQLLLALQERENKNASSMIRACVYWYAKQYLPEEEFQTCFDRAVMLDKL